MNYALSAAAEEDIRKAYRWYRKQNPWAVKQFLSELDSTFERICQHPHTYLRVSKYHRRAIVRNFPYKILYNVKAQQIEVVAVLHLKRHAKWQSQRMH